MADDPELAESGALPKASRRLNLSVQYACNDPSLPSRPRVRAWVRAAEAGGADVTVRFVDEAEGRQLNRDFRHKDYATNVLSFPYLQTPQLLGDLALCVPVVLREAAEQGKTPEAHFAHLIVHGMLHLQGFDHETDAEADEMEAREREVLAGLGIADPYAGEERGA